MEQKPKFFKVKKITTVDSLLAGKETVLPISDYIINDDKHILQFEYVDEDAGSDQRTIMEKGVYRLTKDSYGNVVHKEQHFNPDKLLSTYSFTDKVMGLVDKFFSKLDVYKKRNIFPKRAALLHSNPGLGKTSSILAAVQKYSKENTITFVWPTSVLRAHHVKEYLSSINVSSIDRMILIIEDLGGGEINYTGGKIPVEADLLSLLDNSTNNFEIPTMIIATTNYPGNLLEPLLRTGRFDDIVKIDPPNSKQRAELLSFFAGQELMQANPLAADEIAKDKYDGFSVSDIKEIPLKAELNDESMIQVMLELKRRNELVKNNFEADSRAIGIIPTEDDLFD